PAAVLKLATELRSSDKEDEKAQAQSWFEKYVALEPDDPRGHSALASLYHQSKKNSQAEAEYRAAINTDASNTEPYIDLAEFLAALKRYREAVTVINDARKHAAEDEDVVVLLFQDLMYTGATEDAENIARLMPAVMSTNSGANLYLGRMLMESERAAEALPVLRKAAELDKKSSAPWSAIAECYRNLKNWTASISAANTAIDRDAKDAEAFYQRACAQARLGRLRDAMASLKQSIELEPFWMEGIEDEVDLKPLSTLPEFKKLLADRAKK